MITPQSQSSETRSSARRTPRWRGKSSSGFTLIEIVITIILLGAVAGILLPFFTAITHSPDPVIRERAISLGQAMMDEIMAKRWDENTPVGGGPIITTVESSDPGPTCVTTPCSCTDRLSRYACDNPSYTLGISATSAANLGREVAPAIETRIDWDDVDDYNYDPTIAPNGINETNTFIDQNGNPFSLPGYTRKVLVCYIPSGTPSIDQNPASCSATTTDTKRVVVTITSPLGEEFNFVAVACNI